MSSLLFQHKRSIVYPIITTFGLVSRTLTFINFIIFCILVGKVSSWKKDSDGISGEAVRIVVVLLALVDMAGGKVVLDLRTITHTRLLGFIFGFDGINDTPFLRYCRDKGTEAVVTLAGRCSQEDVPLIWNA